MAAVIAAAEATLHSLPADEHDKPEVATLRRQLFFEGQLAGRRFPICRISLHVYRYQYRMGTAGS